MFVVNSQIVDGHRYDLGKISIYIGSVVGLYVISFGTSKRKYLPEQSEQVYLDLKSISFWSCLFGMINKLELVQGKGTTRPTQVDIYLKHRTYENFQEAWDYQTLRVSSLSPFKYWEASRKGVYDEVSWSLCLVF